MTRTSRAELESLVRMLNDRLGRPEYGWDRVGDRNVAHVGALTLDISYGQPRLHEVLDSGGGVNEVGPRLPAGQMALFLRAMLHGVDFAEANLGGYGTLPRWDQGFRAEDMGTAYSRERREADEVPGWNGAGAEVEAARG
jgi:hypothetical protein